MSDWFSLIELITGFTAILLSACFLLLVKYVLDWLPSKNYLMLLLSIGIVVKGGLFVEELFNNTPAFAISLLTFPLVLLLGPVLSGFTKSTLLMENRPTMNKSSYSLLILGYLLVLPILILIFAEPLDDSTPYLPVLASTGMMAFIALFIISSSYHFVPILWRLSQGALYSVGYGENTYHWLRGIWLSISAIWLMLIFSSVAETFFAFDTVWHIAISDILDLVAWFALLFYSVVYCRKPKQDHEVERCKTSGKYEKSALTTALATQMLDDVEQLMQTKQLYLESNITLDKVASMIKTQPQYLSQAINQYRQVNFYEFIAGYRIEFAKSELKNWPNKSILDIAMSAGFNAKSTFNLTFKKIIGSTPSDYRKQQLS
jgi:AraC-like DNA-binding protein